MNLHNLEKKILLALKEKSQQTVEQLKEATGLDTASANHASAWLMSKGLVELSEKVEKQIELGEEGKEYLKNGLPERRALNLLKNEISVEEARKKLGNEANIAIAWLAKEGIIKITDGKIKFTEQAKGFLKNKLPQEKALEDVSLGKQISEQLEKVLGKRGNIIVVKEKRTQSVKLTDLGREEIELGIEVTDEISQLTPEMLKTGSWKNKNLREYDIQMPVKKIYPGKRHPVCQAAEAARRVWLEMGFKEMRGPLIDSEFWNFDALFVPQNHPAREMQDTIFVDGEKEIPKALADRVKKAHEEGVDGSSGWKYKWSEKIAKRLIMRPHTTCLSTHVLSELKKADWPAKYFAIGRVFRNEAIDWKHGFEFNHNEGIVVDPNANFRNHIAYLRQFYTKLGFPEARFKPSFYPYTEMSLTVEVFNTEQNKWVEIGGSGIFRAEVTEPLLGEPVPVLAWGIGFDRIIMNYYGITHFNDIYRNDIKQLREFKSW